MSGFSWQAKPDAEPESVIVAAGGIEPAEGLAHLCGAAKAIGQGVAIAEIPELDRVDRLDGEPAQPGAKALLPARTRGRSQRRIVVRLLPERMAVKYSLLKSKSDMDCNSSSCTRPGYLSTMTSCEPPTRRKTSS